MPVFSQYPKANLPLTGEEVTILAQNGLTVNASVNQIAAGVLPSSPAPLLGSSGGAYTTVTPDNITIKIADGVLSANAPPNSPLLGGTGSNYATVFPDGVTLKIATNELQAITNAPNALLQLTSLGVAPLSVLPEVALQAGTQAQSNVLVGPTSGSGPTSWRQLSANDISGNNTALGLVQTDANNTISTQQALPTGTTSARSFAASEADQFNVLNFGIVPGIPVDASIGINAAIAAANARVQSGLAPACRVVIPNWGYTYQISNPIQRLPGVEIEGWGCPLIQLAANANCAIIEDAYFQTLINNSTSGVPAPLVNGAYDGVLRNLRLDGNVANQNTYAAAKTAGTFDYQCGIMSCGSNPKFERIFISNVVGHGIRTALVINNNALPNFNFNPGFFQDISVSGCGGHCWWMSGPHDSHISGATLITPSLSGTGLYSGLYHDNGALVLEGVHTWTTAIYTAGQPMNAFGAEFHAQQVNCWGCNFEGGLQSVNIQANYINMTGCFFYDCGGGNNTPTTPGVALVQVWASGCVLEGCHWNALVHGSSSTANDVFAVSFGSSTAGSHGGNRIDGDFQQFYSRTPFDFAYDAGTNVITGVGQTPGTNNGTTTFPTPPNEAAGTYVNYVQSSTKFAYRTGCGYLYGNQVNFLNATTGNNAQVTTTGSVDNNAALTIHTQGSSGVTFSNDNGTGFAVQAAPSSAVNYPQVKASVTGSPVIFSAAGTDSNIPLEFLSAGTGGHYFATSQGTQFHVGTTASAVNNLKTVGAATGSGPTLSSEGSDTNVNINYVPKGTGVHVFTNQVQMPNGCLLGPSAPGRNAVNNFPYLPMMSGSPTSTPATVTGYAPFTYDTTDKKLWVYDPTTSAWIGVVLS